MENSKTVQWSKLLNEAVSQEGIISDAYSTFYNYSVGNQLLAWIQCLERKIPVGPLATLKKWNELGRRVKAEEKAISLYIPSQFKVKEIRDGKEVEKVIKYFALKPRWYVLSQTHGEDFVAEKKSPQWDAELALKNLDIRTEAFEYANGNCQGYAKTSERVIAINPLAQYPHKTRFHEIAHVLLHGKAEEGILACEKTLVRSEKEVEAESVAYILISLLNLDGQRESRGYIQNWLANDTIGDKTAARIFGAVEKILKAGQPAKEAA